MPPMINFYSEQIDSSTELLGEYWKTANGYLYSRTTSFVHVPNHVNTSRTIFPRSRNYACTLKNPCCGGWKIFGGRLLLNNLLGADPGCESEEERESRCKLAAGFGQLKLSRFERTVRKRNPLDIKKWSGLVAWKLAGQKFVKGIANWFLLLSWLQVSEVVLHQERSRSYSSSDNIMLRVWIASKSIVFYVFLHFFLL